MTIRQSPPPEYVKRVKERSLLKFLLGFVSRLRLYCKYALIRGIARIKGAEIGVNAILSFELARKANSNLVVGRDSIVEATDLDLRGKVIIADRVIINREVSIIRVGHYIDEDTSFTTRYYPPLKIESYSWLATGCRILPSVTKIAQGSVIGAYAVLAKNTTPMGVYSGNPAEKRREHNSLFSDLIVPSLVGGDFEYYTSARFLK